MKLNLRLCFGWSLVLWGVIVCLFSIFPHIISTRITVMLIGMILFMIGDIALLLDAAIKGD